MLIRNREELSNQINNFAVDSFPGESKPGRKLMNTIVYHKPKDKFYKIEWGEITDDDEVNFLWYNEKAEEVIFNPKGHIGWFTKKEVKSLDYKGGGNIMGMNKILENVETNIVNINELKPGQLSGLNLSEVAIIGAKAGKGKTWYAIKETVKSLAKGESVLFFTTETSELEIIDRLKRVIIETDIVRDFQKENKNKTKEEKDLAATEFIKKSKLIIDNNPIMDTDYIINKILTVSFQMGLNFIVVDSLQMSLSKEARNTMQIQNILNELEDVAFGLECKVLVTTQLNSRY